MGKELSFFTDYKQGENGVKNLTKHQETIKNHQNDNNKNKW